MTELQESILPIVRDTRNDINNQYIIKKWDDVGFLDGLDDVSKENVALAFEEITYFLDLENASNKKFDELIFLFPTVRRVLSNIKNDKYVFNVETFLKLVFSCNNNFNKFLKESDSNNNEASKYPIIADSIINYIDSKIIPFVPIEDRTYLSEGTTDNKIK